MKKFIAILLTVLMIFSLVACSDSSASDGDQADTTTKEDQLYIFVTCLNNLEFMQNHIKGFEEACKELGVRGEHFGPDDAELENMTASFEQAIAMNPDGILVAPINDMGAMVDKALEAGIPTVYVDINHDGQNNVSYCGTGNYELGKTGAAYLADVLGGEGKVAQLYAAGGGDSVVERISGYDDGLAEYPGIEIVAKGDTNADYEQGTKTAAAILQANPDLDAFVCLDSTGGTSAATAIKEAGLEGKVHVISLDKDAETLQYIKEGVITATVAQNTQLMSYYGTVILYSLANSVYDIGYTEEMGIWPVPKSIDTGSFIIDASNVDNFISE